MAKFSKVVLNWAMYKLCYKTVCSDTDTRDIATKTGPQNITIIVQCTRRL